MENLSLLNTITIALLVALAGALAARLLRLPPIAGYLAAGIILSPFTPGLVADTHAIRELAELGVIFLMFGVGLHFDLHGLMAVKRVAVPGALLRLALTIAMSAGLGRLFGLDVREGVVLGFALSISSTVVAIRALEARGMLDTSDGHLVVGWLIVEDLASILMLTLLPTLQPDAGGNLLTDTAFALGKAGVFLAIVFVAGARFIPWALRLITRTGSRELFILATVGGALGIATGASLFGVSVAIGAFVAGVVVGQTDSSQQAAEEVLPFREAFAVLFFVSAGMLMDPRAILDDWGLFLATLAAVIIGKSIIAVGLPAILPYSFRSGLVVAVSLAQIGEFSFIIAEQAVDLGSMSKAVYNAILGVAVASIVLNSLVLRLLPPGEGLLATEDR